MRRGYGHGPAVAAILAAWLPEAWAEIHTDHPTTDPNPGGTP